MYQTYHRVSVCGDFRCFFETPIDCSFKICSYLSKNFVKMLNVYNKRCCRFTNVQIFTALPVTKEPWEEASGKFQIYGKIRKRSVSTINAVQGGCSHKRKRSVKYSDNIIRSLLWSENCGAFSFLFVFLVFMISSFKR